MKQAQGQQPNQGKISNGPKQAGIPNVPPVVFNQQTVDRYLGHFLNILRQNGIATPSKDEQIFFTYLRLFFMWLHDLEKMEQQELKYFDENRQRIRMALQLLDQKEQEAKKAMEEKDKQAPPIEPTDPAVPAVEAEAEQPGETEQPAAETEAAGEANKDEPTAE
jgi:hypothetical protein